jgi:hypothetical protein
VVANSRGRFQPWLDIAVAGVFVLAVVAAFQVRHERGAVERIVDWLSLAGGESGGRWLRGVPVGVNTCVAALLLLRPGHGSRMFAALVLGVYDAALVMVATDQGWDLHCGCFGGIVESSIIVAVMRNTALAIMLVLTGRCGVSKRV